MYSVVGLRHGGYFAALVFIARREGQVLVAALVDRLQARFACQRLFYEGRAVAPRLQAAILVSCRVLHEVLAVSVGPGILAIRCQIHIGVLFASVHQVPRVARV